MEAYIIIISAAITAIAIAYKIANNLKDNTSIFPVVAKDGNYVLSFSNSTTIDPVSAIKVYLKVKKINSKDISNFTTISNNLDWQRIVEDIINKKELNQTRYLSNLPLFNNVIIECKVESTPPIMAEIQFDTSNNITIKWTSS